jgi:hypothetical protein
MVIPWATNLLHFHLNKPFKKWFLIWHYFVLATFQKIGSILKKSSGHPDWGEPVSALLENNRKEATVNRALDGSTYPS